MKDLKYLMAYIVPLSCLFSLYFGGVFSFATVLFIFLFISLIELVLPKSTYNLNSSERQSKLSHQFFDFILYGNLIIVYSLVVYFGYILSSRSLSTLEIIGMALSVGIVLGANGINVAHELGHRSGLINKWISKLLLIPSHYSHFTIEHNFGHHKHVATPLDPASADKNEWIYTFWFKSVLGTYRNAWNIELRRLKLSNQSVFGFHNDMLVNTLLQCSYIAVVFMIWGLNVTLLLVLAGMIGFLLLETINYIEHYGLRRSKMDNGRYERVLPKHSWNSNHTLGRIILYELTRHSDHHYISNKKYQVLDHHEEARQLPLGYPGSMIVSLIPPLWFSLMNKRLA